MEEIKCCGKKHYFDGLAFKCPICKTLYEIYETEGLDEECD